MTRIEKTAEARKMIIQLRCKYYLAVEDIANYIGVSRQVVHNWFNGDYEPCDNNMEKLYLLCATLENETPTCRFGTLQILGFGEKYYINKRNIYG